MAQWTFNAPSNGYKFRITLTDVNVSIPGNTSQVAWVIEHYQASTNYNGTMNRYLDINGQLVYNYNNTYNTTGYPWNSWWTVASGTSAAIAHNPDGSKTISVHFYWSGTSGGYGPGTVDQWFSFALTTIPRYAVITGNTATPSDVGFSLAVTTDSTCDTLAVSIDNGATYPYSFSGDFTSKTVSIGGNLQSGKLFNCYTGVKRKDSQLWSYSAPYTVTTNQQNNFMGFF